MASEPKKDTASETALRAVEDALNIDFTEDEKSPEPEAATGDGNVDTDPDFLELEQRLADAANDLRRQRDEPDQETAPAPSRQRPAPRSVRPENTSRGQKSGLLPANDERSGGLGDISFAVQRTPPSRIYWIAALISLVWLGLTGGFYIYARDKGLLTDLFGTTDIMTGPLPWILGGMVVIPLLLIWAFAMMMRRAQELRLAAQTMTEAAVRLLRPEDTAAASVATVGRAIRREVAAINDGMERAIARASELERFVQSEVGNLERSYSDAEVRLKGLVGELAEERHEIVSHVDLLRNSLADTHTGITSEVDAVASRIEAAVLSTTSRIVDSIDTEGLAVTGKLENVTGRLSEMLSRSGSQIAEAVALRASDFDRMVQDRVSELDNTVEARLTGFGSVLDGRIDSLIEKLGDQQKGVEGVTVRIEQLVEEQIGRAGKEFGTRGMALVKALGTQTKALDKAMEDRTEKIGSVMGERLAELGHDVTTHIDGIMEQLQDRSGTLETTATRIEQAISHNVGRLDDNLRQHALEVARSFTSGSDIITGVLDEALESVSAKTLEAKLGIESVHNDMAAAMEERVVAMTSNLDSGHRRITDVLDNALESVSAKALEAKLGIESVHNDMTSAMDERIAAMTSSLSAGHRRMIEELDKMDNRSTGLTAEIDTRTERMGELIAKAGTTLAGVIDERSSAIQHTLAQGQQRLVEELDKMDNRSTGLVAEMDKRAEHMGQVVTRAGANLSNIIGQRTETIQHSLAEGQQRLVDELDKMNNRSNNLVTEIDKRTEYMGEIVNRAGHAMVSMMDERTEAIQRSIHEGQQRLSVELDKMDDRSTGLVAEIDARTENMGEMVARAGINLASIIDQRSDAIQRTLVEGQQRLVDELDKMDNRSTGLVAEIDKRSGFLSDSVVTAGTSLLAQFDERTATLRQSMDWGHKQLFEQVEVIDQRNAKLLSEMEKQVDRVGSSVRQANSDLSATFESGVSLLRQNIGEGQKMIFGEIENLGNSGAKLVEEISARTELLGETMGNAADHIAGVIDDRNKSIFTTLRQGRDEFLNQVEGTSRDLMAGLDAKRGEFDVRLQEQIEMTGRQIDSKAEILANLLTERAHAINASLGGELLETQRALETRTREFTDSLAERAREISTIIDEHGIPVVEGMRTNSAELIADLERVGGGLTEGLRSGSSGLISDIERVGGDLTEGLRTGSSELISGIERVGGDLAEGLRSGSSDLISGIEDVGGGLAEGLRSGSSELIADIERVGGGLAREFVQLLEKMSAATDNLDAMANQAGTSIASLERNISEGAAQLSQSVERASEDSENTRQVVEQTVASVAATTEHLLGSLSESSLHFEEQVKQLNAASGAVTESQKMLAAVLDARQEPLEQLAANISERSSAIEHSVLTFSGVLSGLIEEMMEKANSAGTKVTAEIENSFEQALSRLSDTVEAMRSASEDIRTELESTRSQMRRGVMELPVEVKESADSMRRVLVDQISALKELSEIVTKSGKAYDMVPPVTQPRLAAAGGGSAASSASGSASGSVSATMRTAANQPVHLEAVRAPAPDMSEVPPSVGPAEAEETRPRPRVVSESGEPHQPAEASELGDDKQAASPKKSKPATDPLHQGGSRDSAPSEERSTGMPSESATESLNSLSMDIARSIDHESAVDVWNRYQRGEHKVFTRDLYTPQGQKTFDEIGAKYKSEPDFRAAVDRYIVDFERLLKDVGRNDRDNVMTQTYLTSDTGKVYTMLAHAAGRIGKE
ncbi:MAG: hypothetical protein LJE67_14435 [Salaquimonas sp.]|nr:hypothetical protein [Salaquimonas sp.]